MQVRIESHTLQRALERGATKEEIIQTIHFGIAYVAKDDRLAKAMIFPFNNFRNNKFYEEKKLEVIYVVESVQAFTVTV